MKQRTFPRIPLGLIALAVALWLSSPAFAAATIVIVNGDPANVGFNDPTVVAPIGGNPGTTLGQQRLNAFQAAANIWGATLTSTVTIRVFATWEALTCTPTGAVLGSAGTIAVFQGPGLPFANTWYGKALTAKLVGVDPDPATPDIRARFNINLGQAGCLTGIFFYLGLDNNHGANVDLVSVLLHEFSHGLGFQTFTNGSTGNYLTGFPSVYDQFLRDLTTGLGWTAMTATQRQASAINTNNLIWTGTQVTNNVPQVLGTPQLTVNSPPLIAGTYQVGTASFGPHLTSPGVTAGVVLVDDGSGATASQGCGPLVNSAAINGKIALVDRGTCSFAQKTKNAQNAGAIGVIIANNAAGAPPGMTGTDITITIPAVSVTQADGITIKAQLGTGVNATLVLNHNLLLGADPTGHALLYTPNPFQGGSSVSHWSTLAFPNQLMEPAINADLTHNVTPVSDLTTSLLQDIGWMVDCGVTCPANITQPNDPNQCGAVVNFAPPTTTGNCGTVTCSPSPGSFFPVGMTTVTCNSGVGPSCPFTVTVTNAPPVLAYNAQTIVAGTTPTINPATGPSDNGPLSLQLQGIVPANGLMVSLNPVTGQVQVTSATLTGNYTLTITATDNCNATTTATLAITVVCPTITMPLSLANGVQATAYNQSVAASPAGGNYTYAVTTNVLPPGLVLNAATGAITGTPTAAGNYAFVITATGWGGCTKAQSYNILITGTCAAITVNPATLPGGTLGVAYTQTVTATGGVAPYTFAVTQGALPAGLSLNAATGEITGAPTATGFVSFRITATGVGGCTGSRNYVVSVACGTLTFAPAGPALPAGVKGVNYTPLQLAVTPGTGYTFSLQTGSLPPGYTLSAAGVLSGVTSQTGTWTFTVRALAGSCQATKQYTLTITGAQAALAQTADYDGDGRSDFAVWSGQGTWRLTLSNGGAANRQAQTSSWGQAGDVSLLGDYDGDGKTDLAVFRPANGTWFVKRSGDGSALVKAWGVASDVPVPGDYDGDGKTDIAIWRGATGVWFIQRSSDGQTELQTWGAGYAPYNDVPVAGDYDGDGTTDLAVFRRATGTWHVKRSSDGQVTAKAWGLGTDVPVAADYDGDGQTDCAVWRGSNWYIWQSQTGTARVTEWGANYAPYHDQAQPGDYDGDGQADVAVWRAADQTWYVLCSQGGSVLTQALGQAGDAPVVQRGR